MANKTCGDCRHISADCLYCKKHLCSLASRDQVSPFCGKWEPKTNGDVIRKMSNGVLAHMMTRLILDGCPISKSKTMHGCKISNDCISCLKQWLNAPAESEGKDEVR